MEHMNEMENHFSSGDTTPIDKKTVTFRSTKNNASVQRKSEKATTFPKALAKVI